MVQLYDCYTITALLTIEDSGFCGEGEGLAFVNGHDLSYRGDFPCNTHGGQLGMGQTGLSGGMSHVLEGVRQIQGRAGERQLSSPRHRLRDRHRRRHERAGRARADRRVRRP